MRHSKCNLVAAGVGVVWTECELKLQEVGQEALFDPWVHILLQRTADHVGYTDITFAQQPGKCIVPFSHEHSQKIC